VAHRKEEPKHPQQFSKEITHKLGGETITLCYQCGTCASSCPVAKTSERFNPREVIKLSLQGDREPILSGDTIWLCCSCYNCQERCPQKVEIADVMYALRNIAIRQGHMPNIYVEFANGLLNEGHIVPMSKFVEKKRTEIGLPPLQPCNMEPLKKILAATGFDKLQRKKEEAQ